MNPEKVITQIERFLKEHVEESGSAGIVIGISGGIDSAVAAFLSVRALGKENVLGLLMPSHTTTDEDETDALKVAKTLGIKHVRVPISGILKDFGKYLPDFEEGKLPKANLQARIRMCLLYYFANLKNYLVCGTTDASENFLGYYTKYGDGAADIEPIINVTKTDLRPIAKALGVPDNIIKKNPSPNLVANQSAEDELGVSYETLDRLLAKSRLAAHKRSPPAAPQN